MLWEHVTWAWGCAASSVGVSLKYDITAINIEIYKSLAHTLDSRSQLGQQGGAVVITSPHSTGE